MVYVLCKRIDQSACKTLWSTQPDVDDDLVGVCVGSTVSLWDLQLLTTSLSVWVCINIYVYLCRGIIPAWQSRQTQLLDTVQCVYRIFLCSVFLNPLTNHNKVLLITCTFVNEQKVQVNVNFFQHNMRVKVTITLTTELVETGQRSLEKIFGEVGR